MLLLLIQESSRWTRKLEGGPASDWPVGSALGSGGLGFDECRQSLRDPDLLRPLIQLGHYLFSLLETIDLPPRNSIAKIN